jgi:hypothetical protein
VTAARRFLPTDTRDFLRSIVPLALLGLAATTVGAAPIVLVLLVAGTIIAARRDAPVRWAWAGAVPVAASLVIGGPIMGGWPTPACTDPGRGLVNHELLRAAVVTGSVVALAVPLRASRASLFVRWPSRWYAAWIPVGFVVGVGAGIVVGWWVFGGWPDGFPGLILDSFGLLLAVVYGLASAVADELAFRAALLGWSARVIGVGPAVVGQAIVNGLDPSLLTGGDTFGVLVMFTAGLLGIVVVRTRSLAVALAIHVGFAATFYILLACLVRG